MHKPRGQRICLTEGCGARVTGERQCRRCYQAGWYKANKATARANRKDHGNGRTRGSRTTLESIASLAMSMDRENEALVTQLEMYLGVHAPELPSDIASIQKVLDDVARPIESGRVLDPAFLHYWSGVFFGVSDTFLKSVGVLSNSKEPWRPLCDFANSVSRALHKEGAEALKSSKDLDFAEKCYRSACRHLWFMSYRAATGAAEKWSPVEEIYELIANRPRVLAQLPGIDRRAARKGRSVNARRPRDHEDLGPGLKSIEPINGDAERARGRFEEKCGEEAATMSHRGPPASPRTSTWSTKVLSK